MGRMARGVPAGLTRVRRPAVAGLFYPSQPAALLATVQELLPSLRDDASPAIAVLLPHAGYQYCGRTAGEVLARVAVPKRCIIVGANHSGAGTSRHGGSAWAVGAYRVPVADVPVDEMLAASLLAHCPLLQDDPEAHQTEHAIEVVLPLLLARQPDLAIVPVLVGWTDWPRSRALGEALAETVRGAGESVLLVASSDMNHHESATTGRAKDELAMEPLRRLDGEGLLDVTRAHRISMCGRTATAAVIHAARLLGAMKGDVVHYSHSGVETHDYTSVVGFAGMIAR